MRHGTRIDQVTLKNRTAGCNIYQLKSITRKYRIRFQDRPFGPVSLITHVVGQQARVLAEPDQGKNAQIRNF